MLARRRSPAAFNWQDFGTSRWQLMIELYINFPWLCNKGPDGRLWPISEATAGGRGDCLLGYCGRSAY
jgi:hypothetical protein